MRTRALVLGLVTLALGRAHAGARPAPDAALQQAEAALARGRYDEAIAAAKRSRARSDADAVAGAALRLNGRRPEARALLEATLGRDGHALAARYQLGLLYHDLGDAEHERAAWNAFYDDYDAGNIDKKAARELTWVAEAARYLGGWQDANDTFRDAVDADAHGKDGARANIAWAALFLEKYDAGHAEVSLAEALKVLPDDADAHALMARVKLEQNDIGGAEREIAAALKANPRHVPALDLRAEKLVDDERYPEAQAAAQAALRVDPDDLRARTFLAVMAFLRDDARAYQAERERALKRGPRAADFFHGVAEFLVKQHRYLEANTLEQEAIAVDPKHWVALAGLGSNWLRLGEDDKGLEALRAAWKGDRYNVRTYNLLNLFEDVIPKQYVLVEGTPFRFRVTRDERPVLMRYVKPFVEAEWRELSARYHFTPATPVTIELFADPQHYAVRTVGLPGLEALGVTFGRVITGMSPMGGRFHWGMMLWHEVGHVFSIQLSRSRVPRWFTEGLSEYETWRHDPDWTRRTHAELYHGLERNELLPVTELDSGFTRARDVSHMVVAYHQAAEEVMFLIRRWGFDKVPEALKLFAAGKDTGAAIRAVTGLEPAAFDAAFRADLASRLDAYRGTFFVRPSDVSDLDALKQRLAAHPDDGRTKGLLALGLVRAHQGEAALTLLGELAHAPPSTLHPEVARELVLAGAELALQRKDRELARTMLDALIKIGHGDGYDARLLLGKIALDSGDLATAEKELARAKRMDPDASDPYELYGRALIKVPAREDEGLRELERAAALDIMEGAVPKLLVERYAEKRRWADVVRASERVRFIDPYDVEVHIKRAEALLALNRGAEAKAEIEVALACQPDEAQTAKLRLLQGSKKPATSRSP